MSDIDLSKFCGTEPYRPSLHQPFSKGDWTYATNGHILVRVKRRPDCDGDPKAPDAEKLFADRGEYAYSTLPKVVIEPAKPAPCVECEGRGRVHECPDCECECEECDGTGHGEVLANVSVDLFKAIVGAKYFKLLQELPNIRVSIDQPATMPVAFHFDGGEGVLMPRRGKAEKHLSVKIDND